MSTLDLIGLILLVVVFVVDGLILAKLISVKWACATVLPIAIVFFVLWGMVVLG